MSGATAPESRLLIVTGATRGLGRALVDRFAAAGHRVAGCGRSEEGVERLRRAYPRPHDFAVVDVSRHEQVDAWTAELIERAGAPDLVVNNAAVINRSAPLWQQSPEEFDELLAINVSGVVNVIRAVVPAMIRRGRGVIANVSSGWGRSTAAMVAPYCASKWAVEGLTRALAQELPRGLAAVTINPGVIDTDMLRSCWQDEAASYPSAQDWSRQAADFLLRLGSQDNGRALTIA